jgi:hypothetical protein
VGPLDGPFTRPDSSTPDRRQERERTVRTKQFERGLKHRREAHRAEFVGNAIEAAGKRSRP